MSLKNETDIRNLLKQLACRIKKEVREAVSQGKLQPREELYFRTKIDGFRYGEKGVEISGTSSQHIVKKTWFSGGIAQVTNSIRQSREYSSTIKLLTKNYKKGDRILGEGVTRVGMLADLLNELARSFLPDSNFDTEIDTVITTFLKKLGKQPLNYRTEVELSRIVVLTPSIEFTVEGHTIVLRPVTVEDLEQEFPVYEFQLGTVKPYVKSDLQYWTLPSAILTIECLAKERDEIAMKIHQAMAILRLFRTAGVDIISHRVYSESATSHTSFYSITATSSERFRSALGQYQVSEEEIEQLIDFWKVMLARLPQGIYDTRATKPDYVTLAYQRYCDALLQNGVLERRIANAVMGLEALFLTGQDELSFRLRTYVAKVLGLLGHEPLEVKDAVKRAYNIRSTFAHGGQLSRKDEGKLHARYGSVDNFLQLILDYLRVSIIIMIVTRIGKEDFFNLVGDSLIDEVQNNLLNRLLSTARSIIS